MQAHSLQPNMMNSDTDQTSLQREKLIGEFLNQIPGRVNGIMENWQHLWKREWDGKLLQSLQERVSTLSETGGRLGITEMKQSGDALHAHLSRHQSQPSRDELVELDGLVKAFCHAAAQTTGQKLAVKRPGIAPVKDGSVAWVLYLLGVDDEMLPGLFQELGQARFQVRSLESPAEFFAALKQSQDSSVALISHTKWLPQLYPTSGEGGLWMRDGLSLQPRVAFISDSRDLQTRLAAMRTHALAYWTLPADAHQISKRMQELTSPKQQTASKVLIVEDDLPQIDFANGILKKAGFECRGVSDPLRVMDILHEFKPDLILMDLYMPGASGAELTTIIREEREFINTPIVFLSGEQDREKQLSALSFGGEDFLAKPISPKFLIKTVTHRIQRARELSHSLGQKVESEQESPFQARKHLFERLDRLSLAGESDGVNAVLYLEVDNAEQIIDTLGISGMDVAMSEVGKRLRTLLHPRDLMSRIGDHSLGLVAHRNSIDEIGAFGKQLCAHIAEQIIEAEGHTQVITLSIGARVLGEERQDANSLFSQAMLASRAAQQAGGNQIFLQQPEKKVKSDAGGDKSLQKLIRKALKENYFELFFQPMVALKNANDEDHYQALIRLQEPDGRLLSARDFIPLAEQMGVISHIDHWTTRKAISVINAYREKHDRLHLFVSQSAELLENIERMSWLKQKYQAGQLHENSMTFEFRLADVTQKLNSAKICFEMLGKMGITTLLTGVSLSAASQSALKHLQVGYIKLDTQLLQDSSKDLKGLISLAHGRGIKVIAPQVEDPRSIAQLWSSGADFVQGNFVQRPENNLMYDFRESILA